MNAPLESQEERRRKIQAKREERKRRQMLADAANAVPLRTPPPQPAVEVAINTQDSTPAPRAKRARWERQQAKFEQNLVGKSLQEQQLLKNHMKMVMDLRKQLRQKREQNSEKKNQLQENAEKDFYISFLDDIRHEIVRVEESVANMFNETLEGVLPANAGRSINNVQLALNHINRRETEYQNKLFELQDTRRRIEVARGRFGHGPTHSQYFPAQTVPNAEILQQQSLNSYSLPPTPVMAPPLTPRRSRDNTPLPRLSQPAPGVYSDPSFTSPASVGRGGYASPSSLPRAPRSTHFVHDDSITGTGFTVPPGTRNPPPGIHIPDPETPDDNVFGGVPTGEVSATDIDAIFEHAHSNIEPVDIPKQMNVSVLEHQRQGLAWLLHQEKSVTKGGILADDMGLGKTVQTICLIYANPAGPDVPERNAATLIVCPLALIETWCSDLKERVHPRYRHKVYVHHGKHNAKTNNMARVCRSHPVVVTTYEAIANEYKGKEKGSKAHPLFDVRWHRVVLDEAHVIKNHQSQRSKAVAELRAKYRLCLSGTPMQNNLHELWPMLRFLKFEPYWDDRMAFKRLVPDKPRHDLTINMAALETRLDRLRFILTSILLRRTKDTEINGVKILANLPSKTSFEININMDPTELGTYLEYEANVKETATTMMRDNSDFISNILVLLLRLRQKACHPDLPQITSKPWKLIPLSASHSMVQQARHLNAAAVRLALDNYGSDYNPGNHPSTPTNAKPEPGSEVKGEQVEGEQVKGEAKEEEEKPTVPELIPPNTRRCTYCTECFAYNDIFILDPCGHSVCPPCSQELIKVAEMGESPQCPECDVLIASTVVPLALVKIVHENPHLSNERMQQMYATVQKQARAKVHQDHRDQQQELAQYLANLHNRTELTFDDLGEDEEEGKDMSASNETRLVPVTQSKDEYYFTRGLFAGQGGRADDFGNIQLELNASQIDIIGKRYKKDDADQIAKLFYRSNCFQEGWIPSTKCNAVIECLYDVWEEAPADKVIVFSFFTSFLDVLSIPLDAAGIKYITYTGELDIEERNQALDKFKNGDAKVLLISLRAGNVGLTLTAANRVFIIEPFWNPYVEDQAKDRVHRIGQTKEVKVYRFVCKQTVEDRIVQLQEKKRIMIESALDKNAREKVMSMSKENILFALGLRSTMAS